MKKLIGYLKEINRKRNYITRDFRRAITIFYCGIKADKKHKQEISLQSVKKILFPFVDLGLGDAICHTGIWEKLKKSGYTIQIISEKRNESFFKNLDCIDEVYIVDIKNIKAMAMIETDLFISIYSWLKRKEYYNAQILLRTHYKFAISVGGTLTKPYNTYIPLSEDFHITSPQMHVLEALDLEPGTMEYSLPTLHEHDNFVYSYLTPFSGNKIIVLNPFASVAERSLSLAQLKALTARLSELPNTHIFIIGEKKKIEHLDMAESNVHVCLFNSLWDAVSLIKQSDLVISVETAVVHIASALNKKQVAIFYSLTMNNDNNLQANRIFSAIGEHVRQINFDSKISVLDIEDVYSQIIAELNARETNITQ
ncbi:glycosyltransferase family 9 protein [Enterobacteriaceae bacterium C23F]